MKKFEYQVVKKTFPNGSVSFLPQYRYSGLAVWTRLTSLPVESLEDANRYIQDHKNWQPVSEEVINVP